MNHRSTTRGAGRGRPVAAALLIMTAGIALLLYPKFTDMRYEWAQWRFAARAAAAEVVGGGGPQDGAVENTGIALPEGAVALLEIPTIDLRAYVVEGTGRASLATGPGHYPGTPLPGETGNAAIAGHRTMQGHVFGDLDRLRPGDEIRTGTARGTATYRVVRVTIVDPRQTDVVEQTGDDRLTLTTCHPAGSASQRLVVVARRTD